MDMDPEDQKDPSQPVGDAAEPQAPTEPEVQPSAEPEQKRSGADDALAEMRRSLREEEQAKKPATGFTARLKRITGRLLGRKPRDEAEEEVTEAPSRLDELQIPEPEVQQPPTEPSAPAEQPSTPEQEESQFGSMVRNRLGDVLSHKEELAPVAREEEPEQIVEPEPVGPVAPTHGILTSVRTEDQDSQQEEMSDLRQEALEDYETAPEEEETADHTTLAGRLQRSWRYMRPLERRLVIGVFVILGLAVLGGIVYSGIKAIPTPTPPITPTTSITPIPISISLPGGWIFPLSTGVVVDGVWRPKGAEWLIGTEVCRLVSLPWTVQLEAVLRTLKSNDQIRLSMSNYDSITYKVQSIEQVSAGDVSKLVTDKPSLLLILSNPDSNSRWVVLAKP